MNLKATKTFESELVSETAFNVTPLGKAKSTFSLLVNNEGTSGVINWEYEFIDDEEEGGEEAIGLWFEGNKVVDYDGVFELPEEAIQMLVENGYDCEDVE